MCFGNYFLERETYGEGSEDHLWLGLVLIVLILVTGMFSYYQDSKSSRIMESFQRMVPQQAKVLRDGERKELLVTELVVGDIVLLETGDRVSADIRVLECQGEACHTPSHHLIARARALLVFLQEHEPFSPDSIENRVDFSLGPILERKKVDRKFILKENTEVGNRKIIQTFY